MERVFNLYDLVEDGDSYTKEIEILINQTIKKVSEDYESLKYNTAIASLMTLLNEMRNIGKITKKDFKTYLILLNPVAPHLTEELWEEIGFEGELNETSWPTYDESKLEYDSIELPVQVNGKVRATIKIAKDANQEEAVTSAEKDQNIQKNIDGKEIFKVIYVPGKILNLLVK